MEPIYIAALYGLGDAYLVCALAPAVEKKWGHPVVVELKETHAAIGGLFGDAVKWSTSNDALIRKVEGRRDIHGDYENKLGPGRVFYAHPHFLRSSVRIDHLTLKPTTTMADMYRAMLQLDPEAEMAPATPVRGKMWTKSVMLFPEARSWPNNRPEFWGKLAAALVADGWDVDVNNSSVLLDEVFRRVADRGWVIGPQCGMMSVICSARFRCRKTIVTPSIDGGRYPGLPLQRTFPYAYSTKFAGMDFDIEEFKIDDPIDDVVDSIMAGKNALRIGDHDPAPVMTVSIDVSPGDFFDRLSIARIKMERFSPERRAEIAREHERLQEISQPIFTRFGMPLFQAYMNLKHINRRAFDHNESMVRAALSDGGGAAHHVEAVRANKERVAAKAVIDGICRSAFSERKSYYD